MKNKTAKFIALLLAVFIFPLSFSACKSGNTELSAESVADICIENGQVWEFGENSVGNCGYCFIDLDFDGMPELVSTSTQGSGLFTTDFFYKINAEKSAVESLPLSGNGNADFKLNAAQDGDYMKLLRDRDGNMFYFFCSYARASAGNYAVSYSRVTVSGGKVQSELLFSEDVYTNEDSQSEHKYYSYADGKQTELSEQEYKNTFDSFLADNTDMHLTAGYIDNNEFPPPIPQNSARCSPSLTAPSAMTRPQIDRITPRPAVNRPKNGDLTDAPVTNTAGGAMIRSGGDQNGQQINIRSVFASKAKRKGDDPKGARRKTFSQRICNIKMGEGSFP